MLIGMKSLDKGPTQVRTVRIPDPLWTRLTEWAERAGIGDSEALRTLLGMGLAAGRPIPRRKPLEWMPEGQVFARVPPGADWWDLDDLVGRLPGAVRYTPRSGRNSEVWWQLPTDQISNLESLFASRPERLLLYAA